MFVVLYVVKAAYTSVLMTCSTHYCLCDTLMEPFESRWGARFSAPVQAGPGAHPASCTRTMGTGSFPGVKSGRGVTLTPHPLLVRVFRTCPDRPWGPPSLLYSYNGYRVFPGGK